MTWILNSQGRPFDFEQPERCVGAITIEDIAESLAKECRFTGKCRGHYSVAQHSIYVSQVVPPPLALEGLLHDASEAYTKDISHPLKQLLPDYKGVEGRVEWVIRRLWGLPEKCSPEVKRADMVLLATERRDLMPEEGTPWLMLKGVEPLEKHITYGWPWQVARHRFLARYHELMENTRMNTFSERGINVAA